MTDISKHFSNFNFQSLISNSNYSVRETPQLSIAKYNHNVKPEYPTNEYFNMYCRGVIVNTETNKIVCLPTPRSCHVWQMTDLLNSHTEDMDIILEPLLDGTMINLFYNVEDSDWEISTRTVIGAECRWTSDKSFRDMFNEIVEKSFHDKSKFFGQFSKDTSYSFVMKHVDNRIVTPVNKNELILVDAYKLEYVDNVNKVYKIDIHAFYNDLIANDLENKGEELENDHNIYGFSVIKVLKCEKLTGENKDTLMTDFLDVITKYSLENVSYMNQGYTLKIGEFRINFKSDLYETVKYLKGNSPKKLYSYIEQRYNGTLTEYLKYFKEDIDKYSLYREKIHIMTQELYDFYCSTFKQKITSLKENVPYQLKPLCYELHGIYLETRKPVHFKMVQDYVNKFPPQRMYFVLKYYFTLPESKVNPASENTHIRFDEETGEIMEQP